VIVSDIGMPGRDGYDLIRTLRRNGVTTPAIALTAFARAEDRIRSLQAGFQTHLPKPVEPTELIAVVASLAGRYESQKAGVK
jgi:CheY-like chemotaxis protein